MTKLYRIPLPRNRTNQKASSLKNALGKKTNQNAFNCLNKQKGAKNETEYEESSVTDDVPSYLNIFKCGRKLLNRLDVTHEQVCMATTKEKYFEKMLETLVNHNDRHNALLSNVKLRQAVSKVMEETGEEERNSKHNTHNAPMDTFCQSPITINTQRKNVNVAN